MPTTGELKFNKATSTYSRQMRTGLDEKEFAKILPDGKSAILEDGTRLRITPKDQLLVDELVFPGDIIKTNYSTGGKVISVFRWECYGLAVYTVTYVDVDAKPNKDGSYRPNLRSWINECVAQDGRILKLFESNNDEIVVIQEASIRLRPVTLEKFWD